MRKNLNYFMAIAVALTMGLSSCSKDSDPTPAQDIAKDYTGTELTATNAGETIPGGSVKIEAIDNTTAKITLNSIVNGQPSFEMNAAVVQTKAEYAFTGAKDIDGMKVAVKGVVIDGKATVDVAVEITGTNILKSWTFNTKNDGSDDVPDFIIFNLQNKSGKAMFGGNEVTIDEYNANFNTWITLIGAMSLQNLSLTFNKDGYVGLTANSPMAPEGQQDISLPKLARYYYSPAANLLIFDAPLGDLLGNNAALSGTMQVPFVCKIENNVLTATIQPEFLSQLLPLVPTGESLEALLSMLDSVMPPDLASFAPIIKMLITDLAVGITDPDVTSLTIGAKLKPVPAAPAE